MPYGNVWSACRSACEGRAIVERVSGRGLVYSVRDALYPPMAVFLSSCCIHRHCHYWYTMVLVFVVVNDALLLLVVVL